MNSSIASSVIRQVPMSLYLIAHGLDFIRLHLPFAVVDKLPRLLHLLPVFSPVYDVFQFLFLVDSLVSGSRFQKFTEFVNVNARDVQIDNRTTLPVS